MAENSEEGAGDPRIKNALFLGKERKTVTTYGSCESSVPWAGLRRVSHQQKRSYEFIPVTPSCCSSS
jgi:hypothetical protein